MRKILFLMLAALVLVANCYAVQTPTMANVKAATADSNSGRDHIDVIMRYFPDDSGNADDFNDSANSISATPPGTLPASEGAVVIFATQPRAIIGRDVTVTTHADSPMVAGIVVESGGIASGDYGRVRIYGYFDDVLAADSTDAVAQSSLLGTSNVIGQVGASGGSDASTVGVSLDAGSGSDGALIQAIINVTN